MKKLLLIFMLFMNSFGIASYTYASGGMTHMYVAQESIHKITDIELRKLLWENIDAYLVGAYYPDAGYIRGGFGEISHWDPFIYKFADYIREKYPQAVKTNPKIIAFLMGIASHRVSDEISHWTFYPIMMNHDFPGNMKKTHSYGDIGIDLLINIDRNQWQITPMIWWVPLRDLLNIYEAMHVSVKKADLIFDVGVLSLAGFGERLIALPAYPYLWLRMPWTARHYYTWPEGGTVSVISKITTYQMKLWHRLQGKPVTPEPSSFTPQRDSEIEKTPAHEFAEAALQVGAATIETKEHADGSVTLSNPVVQSINTLNQLLSKFLSVLTQ